MDIKDVNINNLTPEELAQVKRQGARNFMSFVALKIALYAGIALFARYLRKRLDKKTI